MFKHGQYLGWSGFTGVGAPKVVPAALVDHVEKNNLQGKLGFNLFVGASAGPEESRWALNDMILRRTPHQVGKPIAAAINDGRTQFFDKHLSMFPQDLTYGYYTRDKKDNDLLDFTIIEATAITEDGSCLLYTSNISESLRNVPHRHRVSLYRQNLIATNRANSTHDEIEYVEDFPSISDSFVEDNQQDNSKAENNIVENYIIENNIVEDNMVENNIVENNVVEKNIVDSIPQTIQENTIEQNQLDSKGVSKFKKGILQSLPRKLIVNEALPNAASGETWNRREMIEKSIVEVEEKKISPLVKDETDGVHREVVERQPTTTASTASDKEKVERKVSKFRANRTKLKSSAAKNDLFEEDRSIQRSDLDEANISIEEDEVIDEEVRSHSSIKETTLDYLSLQDLSLIHI